MNRPAPIKTSPTCSHCGNPLSPGGYALACGAGGKSYRIALPGHCADAQCRKDRSAAAIAKAIADGVIDA